MQTYKDILLKICTYNGTFCFKQFKKQHFMRLSADPKWIEYINLDLQDNILVFDLL